MADALSRPRSDFVVAALTRRGRGPQPPFTPVPSSLRWGQRTLHLATEKV